MIATLPLFDSMLESRLPATGAAWLASVREEIRCGVDGQRLASLISMASRHAPRGDLDPSEAERAEAARLLAGWNPDRWTTLEVLRVELLLQYASEAGDRLPDILEECFRYADAGELTALYRSLAHLPAGERFVWRAGEGCRTNMRTVFEATACDTPYVARFLDDAAWCQLVIKAVFIEAPLWRVHGLDRRLSAELARMALDLADERRSAGRIIPPELWLCLGTESGSRGVEALAREARVEHVPSRQAAALALARAGEGDRLRELLATEPEAIVRSTIESALAGRCHQSAFAIFEAGRD